VRGGLSGFASLLESPFWYVPHDAVIPAALTAGDLCDVTAALAPHPLRMEGLVNGLNREVPADDLAKTFEPARIAYRSLDVESLFQVTSEPGSKAPAAWLLQQLQAK
jgi:hypothetical protein